MWKPPFHFSSNAAVTRWTPTAPFYEATQKGEMASTAEFLRYKPVDTPEPTGRLGLSEISEDRKEAIKEEDVLVVGCGIGQVVVNLLHAASRLQDVKGGGVIVGLEITRNLLAHAQRNTTKMQERLRKNYQQRNRNVIEEQGGYKEKPVHLIYGDATKAVDLQRCADLTRNGVFDKIIVCNVLTDIPVSQWSKFLAGLGKSLRDQRSRLIVDIPAMINGGKSVIAGVYTNSTLGSEFSFRKGVEKRSVYHRFAPEKFWERAEDMARKIEEESGLVIDGDIVRRHTEEGMLACQGVKEAFEAPDVVRSDIFDDDDEGGEEHGVLSSMDVWDYGTMAAWDEANLWWFDGRERPTDIFQVLPVQVRVQFTRGQAPDPVPTQEKVSQASPEKILMPIEEVVQAAAISVPVERSVGQLGYEVKEEKKPQELEVHPELQSWKKRLRTDSMAISPVQKKKVVRRCGICKSTNHDRRKCPQRRAG